MSDPVAIALIVAGGGAFQAMLAVLLALLQQRNHDKLANQVENVHKEVNGQTEKLLAVSGAAREAEGILKGRAEQKAEARDER